MQIASNTCPVCRAPSLPLPPVHSSFSNRNFDLRHCGSCGLSFIANPRTDFDLLYDAEYYAGRGADALVNYLGEMDNPRTIRTYEWRGITRAITSIMGPGGFRWLDYGCGLGGLVRYARTCGMPEVYGFDEGWPAQWMLDHNLPLLTRVDLETRVGTFDVVTAIEVIEHVSDPVAVATHIASLLKPGGLFLLTTGNAEPHRRRLASWSYVNPDVHVAYFEPRTLEALYDRSDLVPFAAGFLPGYEDIVRYKVLKVLRVSSRNWLERAIPWKLVSRIIDRRHKVTALPLARRRAPEA